MTLSFDISTSCIGYSLFNEEGTLMELNCIKYRDGLSLFEKLEEFKSHTKHLSSFKVRRIAIEEPLKKFMGKFSSAHTIAILNFFNGMISSYLYTMFGIEPVYYNASNARKIVFPSLEVSKESSAKHEVWKKVMEMEPQINWRYGTRSRKLLDENYDMCDAYVIGACDQIMVIKQLGKVEKVS